MKHSIMKQLLFTLITISILTGCKTEKQESEKAINPLPLNTYFQNSELPAAIMGYSNKEGLCLLNRKPERKTLIHIRHA